MYFKTLRTSDTGKNFQKVEEKASQALKDQKALADELGFESWREGYWQAFGAISSVQFKEETDKRLWKINDDGYIPKLNSKEGKKLQEKFDLLTRVSYDELNKCVGFDGAPWKHIGVTFKNKNFYGFSVGDDWDFKIPEDCTEITLTEYKYLFQSE